MYNNRTVVAGWRTGAAVMVATAITAPAALADQQIGAAAPQRYTNPAVTIAQGERLTFRNSDVAAHDVTANDLGTDSAPLFSTPLIGQGQDAFVDGSQYLTTGSYGFVCSIHRNMTGTLTVTSEGTPVPRPGPGSTADTTAPKLTAALKTGTLRKARADRALTVVITLDEAAKVVARATTRGTTLATSRRNAPAGETKLRVKLDAADRARLRKGRSVSVRVTVTDAAGNRSARTVKRTLK